jgi:predicted deacylase
VSGGEAPAVIRVGSGRPELWIVAGVHGDEVEGIACVEEALAGAVPGRGTLVGVPVAHPAALAAGTRTGPDGADLNRTYPGRPDGFPTERVAHALWNAIVEAHPDALLTIHSWSRPGCVVPYVEHARGDGESRALAHALGLPFAEAWEWPDGLLPKVCLEAGILAAELELGGLGRHTSENLALGLRAVRAAEARLGMRAAEPVPPTRPVRRHRLEATEPGRARQLRVLGEPVRAGDPVCELRGRDGAVLDVLASPVDGWVAAHDSYGEVRPGEPAAMVFEAAG